MLSRASAVGGTSSCEQLKQILTPASVRASLSLHLLRHLGDARYPIYVLPGSLKDYVEFLLYGRLVVDPCEAITCREIRERVGGPGIADVAQLDE